MQQLPEINGINLQYTDAVTIAGAVMYDILLDHNFVIGGFLFLGTVASTIHTLNKFY